MPADPQTPPSTATSSAVDGGTQTGRQASTGPRAASLPAAAGSEGGTGESPPQTPPAPDGRHTHAEVSRLGVQGELSGPAGAGEGDGPLSSPPALVVYAFGDPAGQGAIRRNPHGKGSYHANAATLKPWRKAVQAAACETSGRHPYKDPAKRKQCAVCGIPKDRHALLLGAVALDIAVTVPALKADRAHPITRSSSDWDHYGRAISDALTGVVYADDSQVVDGRCRKTYPGVVLNRPGALIRVWSIDR